MPLITDDMTHDHDHDTCNSAKIFKTLKKHCKYPALNSNDSVREIVT